MMDMSRMLSSLVLTLICTTALAAVPAVNAPLPPLSISERGELVMSGDDFSFVPWRSDQSPGTVHVVQYFAATQGASETFKPFTDRLEGSFEPGTIHVTTILNLDAATWGTTPFVISELKKNKRIHPKASMVVDDKGTGVIEWGLGKEGAGLLVMDRQGIVKYFTRQALSEQEIAATLQLMRSNIGS
jgi:YtfJ family uncharacterized protein